jgi:hypothetical protein
VSENQDYRPKSLFAICLIAIFSAVSYWQHQDLKPVIGLFRAYLARFATRFERKTKTMVKPNQRAPSSSGTIFL